MGNLTIGIKEHTIFPETSDEDLKDVFGLAITIVTTAKNKKEAFFRHLGLPLRRILPPPRPPARGPTIILRSQKSALSFDKSRSAS
jgi:hypothetical protein